MISEFLNKLCFLVLPPKWYAKYLGVNFGKNCFISTKLFSTESYLITIGDNVRIAKNVLFLTHGGIWPLRKLRPELSKLDYFGRISIGNNVYIGRGAVILPGVTIGDNCVIGTSAVVTKSIEAGSIVAGNPARVVGNIDSFADKMISYSVETYGMDYSSKRKFLLSLPNEAFIQK